MQRLLRPPLTIRRPRSSSNGHCCVIPTIPPASMITIALSKLAPIGPACRSCADAQKQGCGKNGATQRPCVALLASDRAGAAREVRAVWHSAELSAELEGVVANAFRDELTAADDIVRMDRRIAAKDFGAAMRAAKRLGAARVEVVKACEAAEANTTKGGPLLAAVPEEAKLTWGTPCAGCTG